MAESSVIHPLPEGEFSFHSRGQRASQCPGRAGSTGDRRIPHRSPGLARMGSFRDSPGPSLVPACLVSIQSRCVPFICVVSNPGSSC